MMAASRLQGHVSCLASSHKPGILVVDDDDGVRQILARGLRHHGFDVWLAASGKEAVDVYQHHRQAISLVLLDVKMPGLDGPATLGALETMNPQVRSVFMSGHFGKYSEADLLRRGAKQVFNKPFDLAELAARLRQLIDD
jgi:CheY-like chemotaxis protein